MLVRLGSGAGSHPTGSSASVGVRQPAAPGRSGGLLLRAANAVSSAAKGTCSVPPHHHNGPDGQAATPGDPAPQKPPWLIRVWPYVRAGLQLVSLFVHDEGLHLMVQALVAVTDLAVKIWRIR
jgi:hypothetical protein